jgi:hypothetical protein
MYNLGQSELQSVIPEVFSNPDLYTIYVINLRYSKIGKQREAKVAAKTMHGMAHSRGFHTSLHCIHFYDPVVICRSTPRNPRIVAMAVNTRAE